jgi:hypothetical protein
LLLKPFGPVQLYVPPPFEVKLIDEPAQTVAPVAAAVGFGFTTTDTVAAPVHEPPPVTKTV